MKLRGRVHSRSPGFEFAAGSNHGPAIMNATRPRMFSGLIEAVMLLPRPRRCQAERRDSMRAQHPRDEGCRLVVSETVVDLEHAQFDRREALRRQVTGHTSHVLDGPDAIAVSGREPDPRVKATPGARHDVAVEDREGSEDTLAGRDGGGDVPADGEPGSEKAGRSDTENG